MPVIVTDSEVIDRKLQRIPKPDGVRSWHVHCAGGLKKYQVLIKHRDGTFALIRFGDKRMEDYTQHHDKARRSRFMSRFAKSIELYKNDHMRPMFYSYRLLWNGH